MDQNNQQVMEIDILKLVQVVLRRWWVVILSGLLVAALVLGYTIGFIAPKYESNVLFYVNNSSMSFGSQSISISTGELSAAKTLVDTYCVILKTRLTLEDVSKNLKGSGLSYSYEELNRMIRYEAVNETEIFRVTVTSESPSDACTIANTIAEVLPQKISSVVDGSSVRVVDYAVVASGRTSPDYGKNTIIGFAAGVVFAIAVLVVLYLLNDTITSEEWIISTFKDKLPLLATIPDANGSGGSNYNYKYGKYKYKYGSYKYGYGGYRYGYRNGYYGIKSKQNAERKELEHRLDSI